MLSFVHDKKKAVKIVDETSRSNQQSKVICAKIKSTFEMNSNVLLMKRMKDSNTLQTRVPFLTLRCLKNSSNSNLLAGIGSIDGLILSTCQISLDRW